MPASKTIDVTVWRHLTRLNQQQKPHWAHEPRFESEPHSKNFERALINFFRVKSRVSQSICLHTKMGSNVQRWATIESITKWKFECFFNRFQKNFFLFLAVRHSLIGFHWININLLMSSSIGAKCRCWFFDSQPLSHQLEYSYFACSHFGWIINTRWIQIGAMRLV